jgi:hypothetical protein
MPIPESLDSNPESLALKLADLENTMAALIGRVAELERRWRDVAVLL